MKKVKSIIGATLVIVVMGFCANAQVQPKDTMSHPKPRTDTLHRKPPPPKPSTNKPPKTMDTVYRAPKPGQIPPKK